MRHFVILVAPLALFLSACGATPLASVAALSRIDPATTDLAALRAAVIVPESLRPRPGTARLVLRAMAPDGAREGSFGLEPDPAAADSVERDTPPEAGRRVSAFRLAPDTIEALERFRREAAARGAREITLGVAADACRLADPGEGTLPITTLLRTRETTGFVVLARFDLRQLVGPAAIANLPVCGAEG